MPHSNTLSARNSSQDSTDPLDLENYDFKEILRKFLRLNSIRLDRTKDSLTPRQLDFLQLLPLLFHINHPLLPGFVSSQCPTGIPKYNPDKDTVRCARRLAKSFEYKRRAYRQYDIYALYFMGSTGTIAYSDKSDFDVWVCHREDLSALELKELQLKTRRITQWCNEFKLEVNFFLINTAHFREGKIDQLSTESSGTTQHMLLLEEFYRTSILLAGRYPVWWLVPPEFEQQYEQYVSNVTHKRLINEQDTLNFGSIANIPAEEFYGATLWHIYKGIDSPYKSILKLLLMECYAREHPDIDLLSMRFKRAVYNSRSQRNKPDVDDIDPYIMMMDKISEHLRNEDSLNRLELARQCLYLKVNESLTRLKHSPSHEWRQQIMLKLVTSWHWKQTKLVSLDRRSQWKIDELKNEHKNIIDALTYSYRKLSDFFRYQNNDIRISKRDLHILGRKLYAAFEKKAGKIELIHHDNEIDLHETHISLHPVTQDENIHSINDANGWAMYIGTFNIIDHKTPSPVKKSTNLIKLLCWGYFNRVIHSRTNFVLSKNIDILSIREIKQILETLEQTFPDASVGYASTDELVKPAQLDLNILFLNIGQDPFLYKHPSGIQIASNQTDALNFGGMHENLLLSIDQVQLTSWREIMTQHFKYENGLLECLCQYLKWNHETELALNSAIPTRPTRVCCFSSVRGESISRRINQLFNDILDAFHGRKNAFSSRFLFTIEKSFYLIWQEPNGPRYQKIPDQRELFRELSYPLPSYHRLIIDHEFNQNKVLKLIYSHDKEHHVQLFYLNHRKTTDIYIIDERGCLYHQSTPIEKNNTHLNHFILFLDSVVSRLSFSSQFNTYMDNSLDDFLLDSTVALDDIDDLSNEPSELQLEVFEIEKQAGQLQLSEQLSRLQSMPARFFRIQVIADINEDGSRRYLIYANEKEFSSFEYGHDVYKKVAEEVVSTRQGNERYPIYITDIDLSPELRDSESNHGLQVTQLLKFKQEIERRLNQAIKNL